MSTTDSDLPPPEPPLTQRDPLPARWRVDVVYRTNNGPVDVTNFIYEMHDLLLLIELGPHWDTIIEIKITRIQHIENTDLTIEQAAEL